MDSASPKSARVFHCRLSPDVEIRRQTGGGALLVPVGDRAYRTVRFISAEGCEVLSSLSPSDFSEFSLKDDKGRFAAGLALDGDLEISGVRRSERLDAMVEIFGFDSKNHQIDLGRIANLSRAAIAYGRSLLGEGPKSVAGRMYRFNTRPPKLSESPCLNEDSVTVFGAECFDINRFVNDDWHCNLAKPGTEWHSWRRVRSDALLGNGQAWKMYISPHWETIRDSFVEIVRILDSSGAIEFKIASTVDGLRRPDHFVAYYPSHEALAIAENAISNLLQDCSPQGVPFSCEVGGDGIVSTGLDPREETMVLGESGFSVPRESWRGFVVNRLASALRVVHSEPEVTIDPVAFAMFRVGFDGIDANRWCPLGAM